MKFWNWKKKHIVYKQNYFEDIIFEIYLTLI